MTHDEQKLGDQMADLVSKMQGAAVGEVPGIAGISLKPEVLAQLKDRAAMLSRLKAGQILAKERLTAMLGAEFQISDPVAAEYLLGLTGVLCALLGVEDEEVVDE